MRLCQTEVNVVGRQPTSSYQTAITVYQMLGYYSVLWLGRMNQVQLLGMWLAGRSSRMSSATVGSGAACLANSAQIQRTQHAIIELCYLTREMKSLKECLTCIFFWHTKTKNAWERRSVCESNIKYLGSKIVAIELNIESWEIKCRQKAETISIRQGQVGEAFKAVFFVLKC